MVGVFKIMFGGCSWSKMERGSRLSGRWYLSFRLSATDKMDVFLILCVGRGASVSCLFGWFSSSRLYLSVVSTTAACLLRCMGSTFVCISQAAVGVDLSAPEMKRRAWFWTLSRDSLVDLLLIDCRARV